VAIEILDASRRIDAPDAMSFEISAKTSREHAERALN
jgi:hypothetical protein